MIATLVSSAIVVLVLMGLFAPFETLGWWAGWYGEKPGERGLPGQAKVLNSEAKQFVVYLTGIGGTSPTEYNKLEQGFLNALEQRLPDAELVDDVFPYASSNQALTGQRVFSWFWRRLENLKGHGALGAVGFLINIRNLWQVLVSSDDRFGPLYKLRDRTTRVGETARARLRVGFGRAHHPHRLQRRRANRGGRSAAVRRSH